MDFIRQTLISEIDGDNNPILYFNLKSLFRGVEAPSCIK